METEMLTRRIALVLILMLAAGCSASTPDKSAPTLAASRQFVPPKWTKQPPQPELMGGTSQQEAGWDNGLILASETTFSSENMEVFTSKDGREWTASPPAAKTRRPPCCGRIVAGYGTAGYVVGWGDTQLTVWRTEDGERWVALPLQLGDLTVDSTLDLQVTIAAGPHGVIVVAKDNYVPSSYNGVYVWHSTDGRSFGAMARVPGPSSSSDEAAQPPAVAVEANTRGFLLGMAIGNSMLLLSAENGKDWRDTGLGLPFAAVAISSNDAVMVAFPVNTAERSDGAPQAWYSHDGVWQPATVDPGHLPDAGVVPADQRQINSVRAWGTGFIAVGNTRGSDGEEKSGLVWYSADGSSWTRMPVRDNEFDTASVLMDVAIGDQKAVLVGYPSDDSEKLLIWHADAPPTSS